MCMCLFVFVCNKNPKGEKKIPQNGEKNSPSYQKSPPKGPPIPQNLPRGEVKAGGG